MAVGSFKLPSSSHTGWKRPSDWLAMPGVSNIESKFIGLHAVYASGDNFVSLRFSCNSGGFTVNWGDGVTTNYASGSIVHHTYDYNTYDVGEETLSTRGYKQVLITVTPTIPGSHFLTCDFQQLYPGQASGYATGFLDCTLNMPAASSGWSIIIGGDTVRHSKCERFKLIDIGGCTLMILTFRNFRSLQMVNTFDTSAVTLMPYMFSFCDSIRKLPMLNTSACTNFQQFSEYCLSLTDIPTYDLSAATIVYGMHWYCSSLRIPPPYDTSNCTDVWSMYEGCSNLEYIPDYDTSACTNLQSFCNGCQNASLFPLLDLSMCTNMESVIKNNFNIRLIPSINVSTVTNFGTAFTNMKSLVKVEMTNINANISFANGQLSQNAIVDIFSNSLLDRSATTSQNINVAGNPGSALLTGPQIAIATAKNWTVTL